LSAKREERPDEKGGETRRQWKQKEGRGSFEKTSLALGDLVQL
jgi:hypothetical protein